ncbi:3-phenylpropionate/trans-cinnamate dioxygenase ferredoxin reductase subunit [Amycolatopsis bartoniae]|uniref:Pyridine nucleotide-disulfide oxidoreductase n=1 Tax=Amycolatopsis bartoniae TaxID=941986 RepID=A0A8H9IV46_9PSEU|nr:FAD-dependent oxidoreductase [Amycolatopsis bartoniae]MBB2940151.1 3-phenylpropionate/trans-cinnamate dioxygenase ferredoxin reductase subunit [Amycolatopsis bartoniae]TVT06255.1 NAD(P)/FAD-dependent oxidoreductase [Amycolatopsis bartoniae]GHF36879.1 pyridine nucleotide-disulfide oxidoreductase [Amycolatopsis bartoniae]
MKTPESVVIAGASAAGLSVAETLRRGGFSGRITLIGEEEHLPYDRPPLSKEILSGKWPQERVWLRERAVIEALGLDLRLGVRATGLDDQARRVELSDGSTVDYDELVIATGARARRLPGTEGVAGVHVLRTLDDALALRAELEVSRRLVIVGAGFLGAEVAAVATLGGAEVSLVSDIPAPLADVLGPEVGGMLVDVHAAHGVRILAGVGVREVLVDGGRARGVRLADGRSVHADAVLVAIGSVPTVDWLAGSGVETGNGVVCDRYCQAAPGVWAAGDVASWEHVGFGERLRIEHRTNAAEQGMAVARNILAGDERKPFTPIPYIWSDQYDLKIQIHGLPRGADGFAITEGSLGDRSLLALYGKNGAVRAAVGVNRIRPARQARALVANGAPWAAAATNGSG